LLFINLCDSSNKDGLSPLDFVVHVTWIQELMKSKLFGWKHHSANKEQPLIMEVSFVNLQAYKVQPLRMEVQQVATFSNIVDFLKAMFLIPHICSELKSLSWKTITFEFVNCLPTKFNGDILFELPPICHPLGQSRQLQGMDIKFDGHVVHKFPKISKVVTHLCTHAHLVVNDKCKKSF
jgi:hypothetical protein